MLNDDYLVVEKGGRSSDCFEHGNPLNVWEQSFHDV